MSFRGNRARISKEALTLMGIPIQYQGLTWNNYQFPSEALAKVLKGYTEHCDEMFEDNINLLLIGNNGVGKAVTLDTPILTTKGWKAMGDITYDDQLFGRDGKPCNITGIYPQGEKQVYRVHFVDGTFVDCCKDHLWMYNTRYRESKGFTDFKTATTDELYVNYTKPRSVFIPVCEAIQFEEQDLPIPPYALGLLIGDGYLPEQGAVTFTNTEKDLIDALSIELKDIAVVKQNSANRFQWCLRSVQPYARSTLKTLLRELGLIGTKSQTKFIPYKYLMSSVEDRMALLQGLIDTDGSVTYRHGIRYSTRSYRLSQDIISLARSLGYRTTFHTHLRENGTDYVVHLLTKEPLFRSAKHCSRFVNNSKKPPRNYKTLRIDSIEILDKFEEMQCISVDSPDHTFICKDYIVTHNTYVSSIVLQYCYGRYYSTRMITFKDLISKSFNGDDTSEYWNTEFLVIDELGAEVSLKSNAEKSLIEELLKYRFAKGLPTIICSNLDKVALKTRYGNTLYSMLSEFVCIEIKGTDGRQEAFRKKRALDFLR